VFNALKGPKRLTIVPGAGHNDVMREEVWKDVETWLNTVLDR
jgi:hypothetical protein